MDSKKGINRTWIALTQLIVLSLAEIYVGFNSYKILNSVNKISTPLVLSLILLAIMICLLSWQWVKWFKSYKEYRKEVEE